VTDLDSAAFGGPDGSSRRGRYNRTVTRRHLASPVVPGHVLLRACAGLRAIGIDARPALERIELPLQRLRDGVAEVPLFKIRDFWQAAVESTGQSALGLRLAELVRPENYEVFGCLIAASSTLGEAVLRATRLISLVTPSVRLSFHQRGDRASLSIEPRYPDLVHREAIEFILGAVHVIARRITGKEVSPSEVRFSHAAPPDISHHQRIFASPVRFRCSSSEMIFDGGLLDLPIKSHDSTLAATLQRQAEELMRRDTSDGFKAQVRAALAAELRGGEPSAIRLAGALDIHPKTLTRRLRQEGTTFRGLLDELRLQLAERYLRQPNLSVDEVAFLLGYSERSAFHRAFRRWTGRAPRESEQAD
jgi:AraC-like DNA-binding protein